MRPLQVLVHFSLPQQREATSVRTDAVVHGADFGSTTAADTATAWTQADRCAVDKLRGRRGESEET